MIETVQLGKKFSTAVFEGHKEVLHWGKELGDAILASLATKVLMKHFEIEKWSNRIGSVAYK